MQCPTCSHENAADSRFCGDCGAGIPRSLACSGCGRINPAEQKFCNGCGQRVGEPTRTRMAAPHAHTPEHLAARILRSRAALQGERKQVTVLFADVKGSMELAEELDADERHLGARASLARALAARGDAARARQTLDEVRGEIAASPELRDHCPLGIALVPALLAVDGSAASSEIAEWIDRLLRSARECGHTLAEPFALQYRGELAALRADDAASARDLRAAVDLFRGLGCGGRADALEQRLRPGA